jgi:hypothetical protein
VQDLAGERVATQLGGVDEIQGRIAGDERQLLKRLHDLQIVPSKVALLVRCTVMMGFVGAEEQPA